ncbi:hypothetical protein RJ639_010799 [Escallonia herrerae]|uniref:Retrotransposon gag domain-containing protein n=1 Tax=Escallonia herrerae TaxID=1293975 RepID=A0AA88VNA2_9ASTE|nr:hypothetical protein RJ639_010799 [Escallonia herrerae]
MTERGEGFECQVEIIFNRLDDLEVDSRLAVLERKVDVFAEELDDLIKERVSHFTKREVQQRKDLKGQVAELQEDLASCKRSLQELRDGCDFKTWQKFNCDLKRQVYPESTEDMAMINLRWLRQKGSICKHVKEYLALMLEIPEMSERQRLCFFVDGLQQWVATELQRREPQDLASAMVVVERLEDLKHGERPRSPRHECAKDRGYDRSKSGSSKATDDQRSPHYRRYCSHKGKMIAFLEKHKSSKGDSSSSDGEACMGALQMVKAFVQKSKEEATKGKKSKKRRGLLYATVDVIGKTQEALVDTGATHNFMSPRVFEWLRLKPTKDGSWFTTMNAKERLTKGVVKNVDLRIGGWTGKVDFNIIDMDELGVMLRMDSGRS